MFVKCVKDGVLFHVLGKMFHVTIVRADWDMCALQGGDVGEVWLLFGTAEAGTGQPYPFRVVLKVQKQWERFGDPDSWRREYDLYVSGFDGVFSPALRWPTCYHASMRDGETWLWLAYVEGVSGNGLTADMLEHTAAALGHFQGRLYAQPPAFLRRVENLNTTAFMENDYRQWHSQTDAYRYIRAEDCAIPLHLRRMLVDLDRDADRIFAGIRTLPVVLCHKDLWLENIFYVNGDSVLIDWDTAGWGYGGEDIASLIADDTDPMHLGDYYRRCVPAYYQSFAEWADVSSIEDTYIREMILFKFGYRLVRRYLLGASDEGRYCQIQALQQIYDMK